MVAWRANSGPETQHSGEFLGFLSVPSIPDLELKKPATKKCQRARTKAKRGGGKLEMQKTFRRRLPTPAKKWGA